MRLLANNPGHLDKHELVAQFLARRPLLDELMRDLRRPERSHHLIVATRGMGKTTLLHRLRYAIEDDPELNSRYVAIRFPEEQNNVSDIADFYLNCLDALADWYETRGESTASSRIDRAVERLQEPPHPENFRQQCREALVQEVRALGGRGLVLPIDNIERIIEELPDEQAWDFRSLLMEEPLVLIAASTQPVEATFQHNRAFYEFFHEHEMGGLTDDETRDMLNGLSELLGHPQVKGWTVEHPGRLRTLRVLTGGNPRTTVLLYGLLARDASVTVESSLDTLLDLNTPLYKARFEEYAPQFQRVLDALATHWDPAPASKVAALTRYDVNNTSALLARLVKQGVVEKVDLFGSGRNGYQVAERFFNIWYIMRNSTRRVKQRVSWLVRFLQIFYSQPELRGRLEHYLSAGPADDRGLMAAYALSVDSGEHRRAMQYRLMEEGSSSPSVRRELAELLDLKGDGKELIPVRERMELMRQVRDLLPDDDVWDLVAGSLSMSPREKLELARRVSAKALEELREERERFRRQFYNPRTAEAWREAVRRGWVADLENTEESLAAALNASSVELRANALVRAERYADARECLTKAVASRPTDAGLHCDLGHLLHSYVPGTEVDAEAHFEEAIRLLPGYARAWNGLGNVLAGQFGKAEEAERAYRKSIDLDPKLASPWNGIGYLLSDQPGKAEEAERAYRKSIDLDPKFARPWYNLGWLLAEQPGKAEEAERACRRSIDLDPMDAYHWNGLGNLLSDQPGKAEEAERAYRKSIDLDPKLAYPWNGLGNLLRGKDEEEHAWLQVGKFSKADKNTSIPSRNQHQFLARIQKNKGYLQSAATLQRFLTTASPDFHEADWQGILDLAKAYIAAGHAADLTKLLDETVWESVPYGERWRPLREAVHAAAVGTSDALLNVAPEIRKPALEILKEIAPGVGERPPRKPANRRPKRKRRLS